jgi:hypothetical protein
MKRTDQNRYRFNRTHCSKCGANVSQLMYSIIQLFIFIFNLILISI